MKSGYAKLSLRSFAVTIGCFWIVARGGRSVRRLEDQQPRLRGRSRGRSRALTVRRGGQMLGAQKLEGRRATSAGHLQHVLGFIR